MGTLAALAAPIMDLPLVTYPVALGFSLFAPMSPALELDSHKMVGLLLCFDGGCD